MIKKKAKILRKRQGMRKEYNLGQDIIGPFEMKGPGGRPIQFSIDKLKRKALTKANAGYKVFFENSDRDRWSFWYSDNKVQWGVKIPNDPYPYFFDSTEEAVDKFIESWKKGKSTKRASIMKQDLSLVNSFFKKIEKDQIIQQSAGRFLYLVSGSGKPTGIKVENQGQLSKIYQVDGQDGWGMDLEFTPGKRLSPYVLTYKVNMDVVKDGEVVSNGRPITVTADDAFKKLRRHADALGKFWKKKKLASMRRKLQKKSGIRL